MIPHFGLCFKAKTKKPPKSQRIQVVLLWSCYPDSNWRPHPYQGCALPTELPGHDRSSSRRFDRGNVDYYTGEAVRCQAVFSEKDKLFYQSRSLPAGTSGSLPKQVSGGRGPTAAGSWEGDGMPLTCVAKLPGRPPAKQNARSSQKSSRRYGRGSKFRTHGTRFWRPLLYQLSYTPMWSCYPDSNWRPHPYQGCALPTEL